MKGLDIYVYILQYLISLLWTGKRFYISELSTRKNSKGFKLKRDSCNIPINVMALFYGFNLFSNYTFICVTGEYNLRKADGSVRAGHLTRRLGIHITNLLQQHNEFNDNSKVDLSSALLPCGKL